MFVLLLTAGPTTAEDLRLAQYHTDLSRRGPGLLLRDILSGDDPQVLATLSVIAAAQADILLLQGIDSDAGGATAGALAGALAERGIAYSHHLSLPVNSGVPTGHDIDGDGISTGPRDAHGYGWFTGQGGMMLLSRFPVEAVRDFSGFLWADLPDSSAPLVTPDAALEVLRLHSVAAWDVTVLINGRPFHILASHASAPVFDGPEDRNGLRNADEVRFWSLYLDGWSPDSAAFSSPDFALMGTLNVDPERGEGRRETLRDLLAHRALQDPRPTRADGGTATADWSDPAPGDLRVDYILPSANLAVGAARVLWPDDTEPDDLREAVETASDHRLVFVDIDF